jgi:hypothetical protein
MLEGLWIVQYVGIAGDGGGAVTFVNGKVLGGDTGYTYVGTYTVQNNNVTARVRVSNFLPQVPNVLGIQGNFDLEIRAQLEDKVMQGNALLVGQPGAGIVVKLTKVTDL